jgi:glycosyltransferase involved in cell wall biosynthesis
MNVIDVVVRCRNEMPHVPRALDALARQVGVHPRVHFFDCGSNAGSRDVAQDRGVRLVDVDPRTYRPGAVLNRAMSDTSSDIVAFVNADAIALSEDALTQLIAPLVADSSVAATFGRQIARPLASRAVQLDHLRAFGAQEPVKLRRGHFFSMAASAVRRTTWEKVPFDEELRYSEDVHWTKRVSETGGSLRYAFRARFEHSHDYSLRSDFMRRRGEGSADVSIYELERPSLVGDLVAPLVGAVLRDSAAGVLSASSVASRAAQATGYFVGRYGSSAR